MQKLNVDGAFKRLGLSLLATIKIIISFEALANISLRSTFGGKSSYSNFSLLTEPMVDLINESLNIGRLSALYSTSKYIKYHEALQLLPDSIPFTAASDLLFLIATYKDRFVDLYIDNFINVCLNKIVDGIHEAT